MIGKKKKPQQVAQAVQTAAPASPFTELNSYVPLRSGENRLYAALREAVPIIDAGIDKIIRLIGSFTVRCGNGTAEIRLNSFLQNVKVNSMDYRTITSNPSRDEKALKPVAEGAEIPQTVVKTQDHLVKLHKRGRMLVASYEALRFQKLDLFTVTLRQIGAYIARAQLTDAVDVLLHGDDGQSPAGAMVTAGAKPDYADMVLVAAARTQEKEGESDGQ